MVFKKKKWVRFSFLPYEYESLEEYLEKMASKGWVLEGISRYYLKFIKSSSKRLRYSVDILDSISFLDGKDTDRALEYREYCKEAGWDFVCESDKIQIYCSEENSERIDIHTDEVEKFNIIRKASFKYVLIQIIIVILILFPQYISTIGSNDGQFLASPIGLGSLLFIFVVSIYEILSLITFIIFIIKGKKAISSNKSLSYDFKAIVLIKRLGYKILFLVLIIASLVFVMQSGLNIFKLLIIFTLIAIVSNYILSFIKNKNYKNRKIIIPIVYIMLSLAAAFIMINIVFINVFTKDYKHNEKMLESVSHLVLEDFNDTSKDESLYCSIEQTSIASYIFYSKKGKKEHLSYDIFESKYEWPVKYNFNKIMKFANKIDVDYIEKQTNLPQDIKVYMNEHGHKYIIISKNKMVEISKKDNISEEELINIVYEKIFK